jgi:heavy metal sensor kinase
MQWWATVPQDLLRRIGQDQQDQPYFVVWGFDGSVIRASSPDISLPGPSPAVVSQFQPPSQNSIPIFRQRDTLREVILSGPHGIRVLVGKSIVPEQSAMARLRLILLAAGAGVMSIGLFGGWLLSRRVTRPIQSISQTAKSISASDLSGRIAVDETHSELGSLAQTLNETFDRLESSFQRQIRFTADASHELRTPLSVIHSHSELALTKERTAPEYRQTIETCLRAARRMKSLVETLLVLARADAGQLELKREPFDLKEAAEESLAMVGPLAQDQKIKLESSLQKIEMVADRTRVSQLITNLLSNAVRYNREGGSVKLAIAEERGDAMISVADTGVGIELEDQPRIFERFFRADKARSREAGGSGLGLAICQSIVEAHGGGITFTSEPGKGTTFTARLPKKPEVIVDYSSSK